MPNIEKRTGARDDIDAYFVCIRHDDTPRLLQHLRARKVKFSVDVEPEPPEGQADEDIFWFERTADIIGIQKLIDEICKKTPKV